VAAALLKGESKNMQEMDENGRVPLEDFLDKDLDLNQLAGEDGDVDFAFVFYTFEDADGDPAGWSFRATAKPNPYELIGALAVEIQELIDAVRESED
jgi:hypothetical protein